MTEARPSNYWIASNALYITLNANGGPDYLLGNTASGAHILCYMKGIDGLEYDAGHNYRRWPLSLTPTHFETYTEKYVYCAIPRPGNAAEMAVIVFPSERLDIYGKNEMGQQIGSEQYYYIWLQGIISSSGITGANDRGWTQHVDTGTLASDEAIDAGGDQTWWRYSSVDDTVTFLKDIWMKAGTTFHNLILGYKELTGVATSDTAYTDSDVLVATPGYVESQYLSKTHESEAQEQVGFLKGLWVKAKGLFGFDKDGNAKVNDLNVAGGANVKGEQGLKIGTFNSGLLGTGAMIAPSGHAEFESIYSRSFISTPEFRFNRISVTEGEQWCTNGYGTIESVTVGEDENGNAVQNGGLITLHLEENDFASVDVGDICRGIYNDIANIYETATVEDDKVIAAGTSTQEGSGIGFPAKTGFFTSYFYIARIVKNVRGECQFIYGLRKSTTPHPCAFMKFAQYGSFTNSERRASSYSSSVNHAYEMRLQGVSTWQIQTANIVSREGWLGDLTIEMADHTMRTLQGYGLYVQDNVYFGNAVIQLDPYTIEMLERDLATYKADFSEYIDMIVVDDTGNVIGGLWTDTEQQGGTTERSYRIHSAISVRKSGVLLTEAAADADAGTGTYKLYVSPVNCTCIVENSTIYITGIDHIKDGVAGSSDDANFDYDAMRAMESCRVDIVIDCEGKTSLTKTLPINIKHDSEPYVGADITNEFSAVSWNTKNQAYIGLPITFDMKMWHNNEGLDIASVNDVSVTPAVTGMTISKAIATLANGQKVARITISALPESLPLVQELNVTCAATYAGVSYERTLVHTINKSTDTNVYSLIPSVSEVMLDKNAGTLNINTVDCDVFCDSSDDKHYQVTYANFGTHEIGLYYKKFYTDGTSDASETEYAGTAISINTSVKEVVFYLYKKVGETVDRTVKHDQEGVPVIAEGQDGKGVEYIFITKQSWDGTDADKPTIYDVAADRQVDNYCPYTDAQHSAQWTDEPTGVGANMRWEFQAMRKKVNGVWQPFGEVKYKDHYVVDGVTPYVIDLSNEQSQIACDENGGVVGNYETSRLMLFKGTSYAFTDFAITITPQNISCNGSASAFTLTDAQKTAAQSAGYFELTPSAITADSATISVSAVYGNITLVSVYRINKSYAGKDSVIYSLQTSLDTIRKDKNGSLVDQTLTLQVKKTVGATTTFITSYAGMQEEGLSFTYDNADATGTSLAAMSISTGTFVGTNGTWGKMNLIKSSVIVDAERINVVTDGDNGKDGFYYLTQYGRSSSRTEYDSSHIDRTYGDDGWSSVVPSVEDSAPYIYIWKRTRLWNPNTNTWATGSNWAYVCETGATGQQGATGRMYYPAGEYNTSKQYYVTSETCPVVMYNNLYWYAKKNVPAGDYAPPNNEYWGQFSNFQAIFVEILFANFAKLGAFVVNGRYFISQYGTLVSANSSIIVDSSNYNTLYTSGNKTAVPYGWFDANDPMVATAPSSGYKFRPTKCIDALTGEEWMAKGNVHIGSDGSASFSGNIHTPYIRLTSSNINNYKITNFAGETVINLGSSGLNLQIEVSGIIRLPRITADMLGCEVNIFNATSSQIEINGSGNISSSADDRYMCTLIKPSLGLSTNTTVEISAGREAKFKAIDNTTALGQTDERYRYSWLCCYVNINP